MRSLDYQSLKPTTSRRTVALVAIPGTATATTLLAAARDLVEEPFGTFSMTDAVIQVGGGVVAVILWCTWAVVAERSRIGAIAWAASLPWGVLNLWLA